MGEQRLWHLTREEWQDARGVSPARFQNNVSQAPLSGPDSNAYTCLLTPGVTVTAIRVPGRGVLLDKHRRPVPWAMQMAAQEVSTHKNFLQRTGSIFHKLSYRQRNSPKVIYNFLFALL